MLRACLFDLDGTLLNSLDDLASSVNAMRAAWELEPLSTEVVRGHIGNGLPMLVRRSLTPELAADEAKHAAAVEAMRNHYAENWSVLTRPYAGMTEAVASLKAAGIKLGVISNKIHEMTVRCVEHFFPIGTFEVILGQREGVPRKPDPAGAFDALGILGVPAAECAYVGDSDVDMQMAHAAGLTAVGVSWGFRHEAELVAEHPHFLIHKPSELLPIFAG